MSLFLFLLMSGVGCDFCLWLFLDFSVYLFVLKNAQRNDRIKMLQNITPGQLDCMGEIAHRIYDQTFPFLVQDLGYFDDRSLVLYFLFADRVSFRRKKATLVHYHRMIARLLRTYNPGSHTFPARILTNSDTVASNPVNRRALYIYRKKNDTML